MKNKIIFKGFVFLLIVINLFKFSVSTTAKEWPLKVKDGQNYKNVGEISDVYCSYRYTDDKKYRLHLGVDCAVNDTDNVKVYSIVGGLIRDTDPLKHTCMIQTEDKHVIVYHHIIPSVKNNDTVGVNQEIGEIYKGNFACYHIHIACKDLNKLKEYNPLSPQGDLLDRELHNTDDTGNHIKIRPVIEEVFFEKDEYRWGITEKNKNEPYVLSGNVDIICEAYDPTKTLKDRKYKLGLHSGIMHIFYKIGKNDSEKYLIKDGKWDGHLRNYDKKNFVQTIFHKKTNDKPSPYSTTGRRGHSYYYILTNCKNFSGKPSDIDKDGRWNTKLRKAEDWDGEDALINSMEDDYGPQYPDGKHKIIIRAGSDKGDNDLSDPKNEIVFIDNFCLYLSEVEICNSEKNLLGVKKKYYNGKISYCGNPESPDLTQKNKAKIEIIKDKPIPGKEVDILLKFSEPLRLSFSTDVPKPDVSIVSDTNKVFTPDSSKGSWVKEQDGNWTYRLEKIIIPISDFKGSKEICIKVKNVKDFQEKDFDGNPTTIAYRDPSNNYAWAFNENENVADTQHIIKLDFEAPKKKDKDTKSKATGKNEHIILLEDAVSGISAYNPPDTKGGLSDLIDPTKFGVYFYDLTGKRVFLPGLKVLLNDPETDLPYKAVYTIQTADHSTGYSECPLLESGYKELYVYATDLAGNMTPTHPNYGDSTKSGLYGTARSLMDYCIGYIYTERYPDEEECFEDPPDDIDIYKDASRNDEYSNNTDSKTLDSKSSFSYDYYNPTYEGYLKGHEAGVFLAGTYPAMDVMTTNLLNPTKLVHSKLWNPEEFVKKHKMVLLPSGSLIGRGEDSALAQKFHDYVNAGGILFVFSQKRGTDFKVLPGSPEGFGYVEDQNCFTRSTYIDTWHPMLASITENPATAHFDGFFTEYPSDATVLLRRTANGQPCLLIYPYGNGHVILSSLYTDYAYGVEMASYSEIQLVRDIIAWSKKEEGRDNIPEVQYRTYSRVIPVEIENTGNTKAVSVKFELYTPEKTSVNTKTYSINLSTGQSSTITYNIQFYVEDLGIWWVGYKLFDSHGNKIAEEYEAKRMAVIYKPEPYEGNKIKCALICDFENVVEGEVVPFNLHIWNNTDDQRTVDIYHDWLHHFKTFYKTIILEPHSEYIETIQYQIPVTESDLGRLWVHLVDPNDSGTYNPHNVPFETGKYLTSTSKVVKVIDSPFEVTIQMDKEFYQGGDEINLFCNIKNKMSTDFTDINVEYNFYDPNLVKIPVDNKLVNISSNGDADVVFSNIMDIYPESGNYICEIVITVEGQGIPARKIIRVKKFDITSEFVLADIYDAGNNITGLKVKNNSQTDLKYANAEFEIKLPDGNLLLTQPGLILFTEIISGSEVLKNFDISVNNSELKLGNYLISGTLKTSSGEYPLSKIIPSYFEVSVTNDKEEYNEGETLTSNLALRNTGRFKLGISYDLSTPISNDIYNESITLLPGDEIIINREFELNNNVSNGEHLILFKGYFGQEKVKDISIPYYISDSRLALFISKTEFNSGDNCVVTISNTGGENTSHNLNLSMSDDSGKEVINHIFSGDINAKSIFNQSFTIPGQLKSGKYTVVLTCLDTETGNEVNLTEFINITGISGGITINTDKNLFSTSEVVSGTSLIENQSGLNINSSQIEYRIFKEVDKDSKSWLTNADYNLGSFDNTIAENNAIRLKRDYYLDRQYGGYCIYRRWITNLVFDSDGEMFVFLPNILFKLNSNLDYEKEIYDIEKYQGEQDIKYVVDDFGRLFVVDNSDSNETKIIKYDNDLNYLETYNLGEKLNVQEINYFDNQIYISTSGKIRIYDLNLNLNTSIILNYTSTCFTVGKENNVTYIYVVNNNDETIRKYGLDSIEVSSYNTYKQIADLEFQNDGFLYCLSKIVFIGSNYVRWLSSEIYKTDLHGNDTTVPVEGDGSWGNRFWANKLTVNNGYIYVYGRGEYWIKKYDTNFNYIGDIEIWGKLNQPRFSFIWDIDIDDNDNIILADSNYDMISLFNEETNTYKYSKSNYLEENLWFWYPEAVTSDGINIYSSNESDDNYPIAQFDYNLQYTKSIDYYIRNTWIFDLYYDKFSDRIFMCERNLPLTSIDIDSNTFEWSIYPEPWCITGDGNSNLFIVDVSYNRGKDVLKVDSSGNLLFTYNTTIPIADIAYDPGLNLLYVINYDRNTRLYSINVFNDSGERVGGIENYGQDLDWSQPRHFWLDAIEINSKGEVFIPMSDWSGSYLEVFNNSIPPYGTWSYIHDCGMASVFESISFDKLEPVGTSVKLKLRTADSEVGLETKSWSGWITAGIDLDIEPGRFIEIQVQLETQEHDVTPEISKIVLNYKKINSPIWSETRKVDILANSSKNTDVNALVITEPGKYTYESIWKNDPGIGTSQVIASDKKDFLVIGSQLYITAETDKTGYKPGENIIITGHVGNNSTVVENNITYYIYKDGSEIHSENIPELSPGKAYPFSISTTSQTAFFLGSRVGDFYNELNINVEESVIEIKTDIPEVVGIEIFPIQVELYNPTGIHISGNINIQGIVKSFELNPDEKKIFKEYFGIIEDTEFNINITGDYSQKITQVIRFGEDADVIINSEPQYPDSEFTIPVLIKNTGEVSEMLPVSIVVKDNLGSVKYSLDKMYELEPGDERTENVELVLIPGIYTIEVVCPYDSDIKTFEVIPGIDISLDIIAGIENNGLIPVTLQVTNNGFHEFKGYVSVATDFWVMYEYINIPKDSVFTWPAYISVENIEAGIYTGYGVVLDQELDPIVIKSFDFEVTEPEFVIISKPVYPTYNVNIFNSMTFTIKNTGSKTGECSFEIDILENTDNKYTTTLNPGEEKDIVCNFQVPYDIRTGDYFAEYRFNNETGIVKFHVKGVEIQVETILDKQLYEPGDTALLTVNITNLNTEISPVLSAKITYAGLDHIRDFTLEETHSLQFNIPVVDGSTKITVGLSLETGRYVYLGYKYLNLIGDDITFYTDKSVYNSNDKVLCTAIVNNTGTLNVKSPFDWESSFEITGPKSLNFSFDIPTEVYQGSYDIKYSFNGKDYRYPIDVRGFWIRIIDFSTDKPSYFNGEEIKFTTRINSNSDLGCIFTGYLGFDDTNKIFESDINLIKDNEIIINTSGIFSTTETGSIPITYVLKKKDTGLLLSRGMYYINKADFEIIEASTDKEFYPEGNEPVNFSCKTRGNIDYNLNIYLNEKIKFKKIIQPSFSTEFNVTFIDSVQGWNEVRIVLEKDGNIKEKIVRYHYGLMIPENITVEKNCETALVKWDKSIDPNVTGYRIYVSDNPNTFDNFENITVEEYLVSGLIKNIPKYVKLKSYDDEGNVSQLSDAVTVIWDYLCPPQNLTAAVNNKDVHLDWEQGPDPDISGYKVYRDDNLIETIASTSARNLSLDSTCIATSNRERPWPYSLIIKLKDGSPGTFWTPYYPSFPQVKDGYVEMDFNEEKLVHQIRIIWNGSFFQNEFTISVWENNTWKSIKSVVYNNNMYYYYTLPEPIQTSKIKIDIIALSPSYISSCQIREFEIYGTDLASPPETSFIDYNLKDGEYHYTVTGLNNLNEESSPSNEVIARVGWEYNPPVVQITEPTEGSWNRGIIDIKALITDDYRGIETVDFCIDISTPVLMTKVSGNTLAAEYSMNVDTTQLWDGAHVISISAVDTLGNGPDSVAGDSNPDTMILKVDNSKPYVEAYLGYPNLEVNEILFISDNTKIYMFGFDAFSGINEIKYRINLGNWAVYNTEAFTLEGYSDGDYVVSYYAADNAGNQSSVNTKAVTLDKTDPSTLIVIGEPKEVINGNIYVGYETPFTFNAIDSGCGISVTMYRINGGDWQIYDG
ncbi:hypothetical protein KAU33_03220, partial [Candidatus Dependentiae bacterium]|nr:hypothetical protein [Candidatus Dependentiae bacterium]